MRFLIPVKNRGIITVILLGAVILLAFLLFTKEKPADIKASIGLEAPSFVLSDLEGKKIGLYDYKDKVVLVNFWATWCDTCKEEKSALQKLINSEKNNARLAVLTILFKDSKTNAEEYIKKNKYSFSVLLDDARTSMNYGLTGVPETFVISKGILKYKLIGPVQWDSPDVRSAIKKLTSGIE
jgi:cytochrome c biogenesis protein CcmG, thiol:disulfide interchange protein DsbE